MIADGLDEARDAISDKTYNTFEDVHARFAERIDALEKSDTQFIAEVEDNAKLISDPLVEEKIITKVLQKDGSRVDEVVLVGDRIAEFKAVIDAEEDRLAKLWRQWEDLQGEYVKLGSEVFGAAKFADEEDEFEFEELQSGYKHDMEIWNLEHENLVEEIKDDIENIGVRILHKLRSAEKVCC